MVLGGVMQPLSPPEAEVAGVASAAASGDRLAALRALRDRLASTIEDCAPRELAPLSRQLTDVLREIDTLKEPEEANPVDDLASRRAERRAAASGQ